MPQEDAIVIGLSKMNRILEINSRRPLRPRRGRRHQSRDFRGASAADGFFYAPDPSSQLACTIGGNIAMNSGGAHCLKYGVTTNNLLGVRLVTLDGEIVDLGGPALDAAGLDFLGLVCGAEGQLGIVTEAWVRHAAAGRGRAPGAVRLRLRRGRQPMRRRDHRRRHRAGGDGIHGQARDRDHREFRPRRLSPRRRGDADHRGRGLARTRWRRELEAHPRRSPGRTTCASCANRMSAMESAQIWKGRKSAFGATGRIADYICMDGTVPTGQLPEALRRIGEICADEGLRVANVFHAGDGNMHPLILYNVNDPAEQEKAERAGARVLEMSVELGGCLTGEHGVGIEKRDLMTQRSSRRRNWRSRSACARCSIRTGGSTRPKCFRSARARRDRGARRRARGRRDRRGGWPLRHRRRGNARRFGRPREGVKLSKTHESATDRKINADPLIVAAATIVRVDAIWWRSASLAARVAQFAQRVEKTTRPAQLQSVHNQPRDRPYRSAAGEETWRTRCRSRPGAGGTSTPAWGFRDGDKHPR